MSDNSLFIFLTHETRLIRQFLPKQWRKAHKRTFQSMVRANLAKREPTSNGSRKPTSHSTTYMQDSCTERNHIAHGSIERARKDAYGPRGAPKNNHASHPRLPFGPRFMNFHEVFDMSMRNTRSARSASFREFKEAGKLATRPN